MYVHFVAATASRPTGSIQMRRVRVVPRSFRLQDCCDVKKDLRISSLDYKCWRIERIFLSTCAVAGIK